MRRRFRRAPPKAWGQTASEVGRRRVARARPGEEGVSEEGGDLGDVAVGGEDGGVALVAEADDVVEVDGLVAGQGAQADVVDDEQRRSDESLEAFFVGAVGACGAARAEDVVGGGVRDVVPDATGALPEGLGEVTLANAGRSDEEDVLGAVDGAGAPAPEACASPSSDSPCADGEIASGIVVHLDVCTGQGAITLAAPDAITLAAPETITLAAPDAITYPAPSQSTRRLRISRRRRARSNAASAT